MSHFIIRFNKTRGMLGRGTSDHVWRVFEDGKEYLLKNVQINVASYGAKTDDDWSICCDGVLSIDRETSTAVIIGSGVGALRGCNPIGISGIVDCYKTGDKP
jgi:hypothetical protein